MRSYFGKIFDSSKYRLANSLEVTVRGTKGDSRESPLGKLFLNFQQLKSEGFLHDSLWEPERD